MKKKNILFAFVFTTVVIIGFLFFLDSLNYLKHIEVSTFVAETLTKENIAEVKNNKVVNLELEEDNKLYYLEVSMWKNEDEQLLVADNLDYRVDKLGLTYPDLGEAYTLLVKTTMKE